MRYLLLLIFFLLLFRSQSSAQNQDSVAIKKYYEENAILWLGGSRYYKNSQSFPLRSLKGELKFSPAARVEFDQFRRNRTYSTIGLVATGGLLVSSLLVKNRHTKTTLLVGSAVTLSISIPFTIKKQSHLSRAIWYYNRDILLR